MNRIENDLLVKARYEELLRFAEQERRSKVTPGGQQEHHSLRCVVVDWINVQISRLGWGLGSSCAHQSELKTSATIINNSN